MSDLPRKLGGEFWFALSMFAISLWFVYLGISTASGRILAGSLVAVAVFLWRMFDRVQKVRLARLLNEHPEVRRIYESVDRQ